MERKRAIRGFLYIMPSLIGMMVFFFIPFLLSLSYCFTSGKSSRRFVGLRHFIELFHNEAFKQALKNTLILIGVSVPLLCGVSLIIAFFLEKQFKQKGYMGAILLLPMALPTSSLVQLWQDLLGNQGILSSIVGVRVDWLQSKVALIILIIMVLWKYVGYHVIIVMSSLLTMPEHFEEAASLEGAGWFCVLMHIKFPYIRPILFFSMVMAIMNTFKIYRELYLLQGNYPNEHLYLLQHFMANHFAKLNLEKLSAAAFMLYILLFIIIGVIAHSQQKLLKEEGR